MDPYDPDPIKGHAELPWVYRAVDGAIFGLGLTAPEPDFNVMAPNYEQSAQPILDDAAIRRLASRERKTRRLIFSDPRWASEINQHSPGSCNGWAGATAEAKTIYLNKTNQPLMTLSGSYLYSLINNGRDQGSALDRGMAALGSNGAPPTASGCTWDKIYRKQTQQYDAEAQLRRGLTMWWTNNKQAFRSAIALGFIGVVCLQWDNRLANWHPTVDQIAPSARGIGNHAIHCQDMVMLNGTETFDCGNSHGLGSGNKGFLNLVWDHFAQPFTVHKFYVIGSVEDHHDASTSQRLLDSVALNSLSGS